MIDEVVNVIAISSSYKKDLVFFSLDLCDNVTGLSRLITLINVSELYIGTILSVKRAYIFSTLQNHLSHTQLRSILLILDSDSGILETLCPALNIIFSAAIIENRAINIWCSGDDTME